MTELIFLIKMKQYDIIIPVKESLKLSVVEHYRKFHNVEDLMLAKKNS